MQPRGERGTFIPKNDEVRQVRSVRLTDHAFEVWGQTADDRGVSRADLLELMTRDGYMRDYNFPADEGRLKDILEELVNDPGITRQGRDRGTAKRFAEALLRRLAES